MTTTATPGERIAGSGLRVTRQRIAVLDAIGRGEHVDVDTVAGRARTTLGSVSRQAVYDVLAALTGAGLLRRIEPAGAAALFEVRVGDNHHHLVCRNCGTIVDVDCVVGPAPCLEPSHTHDFAVDEAEITWWGLCGTCQSARDSTGTARQTKEIPA